MEALVVAPPSMRECTKLVIKGPVKFEKGVLLKGDVEVANKGEAPVALPPGDYIAQRLDVTTGAPVAIPA